MNLRKNLTLLGELQFSKSSSNLLGVTHANNIDKSNPPKISSIRYFISLWVQNVCACCPGPSPIEAEIGVRLRSECAQTPLNLHWIWLPLKSIKVGIDNGLRQYICIPSCYSVQNPSIRARAFARSPPDEIYGLPTGYGLADTNRKWI